MCPCCNSNSNLLVRLLNTLVGAESISARRYCGYFRSGGYGIRPYNAQINQNLEIYDKQRESPGDFPFAVYSSGWTA